jgi:hypothetical protein
MTPTNLGKFFVHGLSVAEANPLSVFIHPAVASLDVGGSELGWPPNSLSLAPSEACR